MNITVKAILLGWLLQFFEWRVLTIHFYIGSVHSTELSQAWMVWLSMDQDGNSQERMQTGIDQTWVFTGIG